MSTQKDKIGVINGLRGYAILAVIFHHLFLRVATPGWNSFKVGDVVLLPFTLLSNGWMGVNLFFILSGFVLFYPYAVKTRTLEKKDDVFSFYKRRAKRLLPLYYISVLFSMIFILREDNIKHLLSYIVLMSTVTFNFTKITFLPKYNDVLWSLGIEVWFSAVFPFLVLLLRKTNIYRVFIYAAIISLATRIIGVYYSFFDIGNPYLNVLKDSLLGRLDDFVLGMLICHLYCKEDKRVIGLLSSWRAFFLGLFFVMLSGSVWDYVRLGMLPKMLVPFTNNLLHIGFFLVIMSLLYLKRSPLKSLFDNHPIQLTGTICYSLYIWHYLAIPPLVGGSLDLIHIAVYLFFIFSISLLTYRFIEFGHVKDTRKLFLIRE